MLSIPPSAKKLALTSLTSGGRSVGIVRLRTEAMEFFYAVHTFHRIVYSVINNGFPNTREDYRTINNGLPNTREDHRSLFLSIIEFCHLRIRRASHATPFYPQKLALTSTSGVCSVGIVRSRTKATELLFTVQMFRICICN
jgi:hypothetical protein